MTASSVILPCIFCLDMCGIPVPKYLYLRLIQAAEERRSRLKQTHLVQRQRQAAKEEHTAALQHYLLQFSAVPSQSCTDVSSDQVSELSHSLLIFIARYIFHSVLLLCMQ